MKKITALILTIILCLTLLPVSASAAGKKLAAITFDDGPSQYTTTLLDGLKQRGAHATFFMNGYNGPHGIENHYEKLSRMYAEGHQLANHTYNHRSVEYLSGETFAAEVNGVSKLLYKVVGGAYDDMVRTPGGAQSSTISAYVGAPIILWSVDPYDWKYLNEDTVYYNIINSAHDGCIILVHDIYRTSVAGALRAIDTLQAEGYEFVTVAELMRRRGVTLYDGHVYTNAPNTGTNLPAYKAPSVSTKTDSTDGSVTVTMSSTDKGLTFYYTTNGKIPNLSSSKYTGPFKINKTTSFTVVGIDRYGTRTPSTTVKVEANIAAKPTAVYSDGALTLSCATKGAEIHYTTDGTTPTLKSARYTAPITVSGNIRAIAGGNGYINSAVFSCTVTDSGYMFKDINSKAWYYDYVESATANGIMIGVGNNMFAPHGDVSRAMMVKMLYNLYGSEYNADSGFTDISSNAWYYNAVCWAHEKGIVKGTSATTFSPNMNITREQFVTILYRQYISENQPVLPEPQPTPEDEPIPETPDPSDPIPVPTDPTPLVTASENGNPAEYTSIQPTPAELIDDPNEQPSLELLQLEPTPIEPGPIEPIPDHTIPIEVLMGFEDTDKISSFALEAMCWAVENGIIYGRNATQLAPRGTVTRVEAATIMCRYLNNL